MGFHFTIEALCSPPAVEAQQTARAIMSLERSGTVGGNGGVEQAVADAGGHGVVLVRLGSPTTIEVA